MIFQIKFLISKKIKLMRFKKIIRAGTIGLGFGLNHAKIFKKSKFCELISICDKKNSLKKYAKILNCNFTEDPEKIINNKSINLVSIASYDNFHFKQIMNSIKNKKNIFVEKPFCQNFNQYYKIKKNLKKYKVKFLSNFVLRNHPKFKKIYDLIKKNKIGKIYHIEGEYNYGRISKLKKGWRGKIPFYSVTQGGGIHIIDLMIWMLNSQPKKVVSLGNNFQTKKSKFKFNDNVVSLINFKSGVTGKVSSNFGCVTPHHHTMKIYGSTGTIIASRNKIELFKSRKKKSKSKNIKYKIDSKYKDKILNSFIESIFKKNKNFNIKLSDVFASMASCLAIDKSLKTQKWEKVKI